MRFLITSCLALTVAALSASAFAAQSPSTPIVTPQISQTPAPPPSAQQSTQPAIPEVGLEQKRKIFGIPKSGLRIVVKPVVVKPGSFDRGIYAPVYADGQSSCAAIMSYNFTQGENPQLKDVTTCTPAKPNSVFRTEGKNKNVNRPPAATLQLISSPVIFPEPQVNRDAASAKPVPQKNSADQPPNPK